MGGGTVKGGRKAVETNKKRHGEDFYRQIGRRGGQESRGGGFAKDPELARIAGAKGGRASRRTTGLRGSR
jgi:general stress protein YciG